MAEPSTCTIVVGSASDFFGGATDIEVTVATIIDGGEVTITWAETGKSFVTLEARFGADILSAPPSFQVPHVDQDGFINGNVDAVKFWAYRATVVARRGASSRKWTKEFQVLVGQDSVHLADIADGSITPGVTAPVPTLQTVAGHTGNVTSDQLFEAIKDDVTEKVSAEATVRVPPLVTQTLAADGTVVQAAAEAVDGALDQAGVLHGVQVLPPGVLEGVVATFADLSGRRTWLEIGPDGGPTEHSAGFIAKNLGVPDPTATLLDWAVYWADATGRVPMRINKDGSVMVAKFAPTTIEHIRDALGTPSLEAILAAGDSMTQNAGANLGADLSADLGGREIHNEGYGGQGAASIASRIGCTPAMLTLAGNKLPATTAPVAVTDRSANLGAGTFHGFMGGVAVTVVGASSTSYTVQRDVAGPEVAIPPRTPFVTGLQYRGMQVISWMGRNGGFGSDAAIAETVFHTRNALAWAGENAGRSLVVAITPFYDVENPPGSEVAGGAARVWLDKANETLRSTFPQQFVDVPGRLRTTQALAAEGVTPTTQDLADIAAGMTPQSFRADGGHYNALGNRHVRRIIAAELLARG
jgi:hypothetical protein